MTTLVEKNKIMEPRCLRLLNLQQTLIYASYMELIGLGKAIE